MKAPLENSILEIDGIKYKLIPVDNTEEKDKPKKVTPNNSKRKLIDTINEYIETGSYDIKELYDTYMFDKYTNESLEAVALDFLSYYSGKGLKKAKLRKGPAILSMRQFVKNAINPKEDWQRKLIEKVQYEGWHQVTKKFLLDNGVTRGSSSFYQEQMKDKLTDDQRERLGKVQLILDMPDNDNIVYQILHGDTLPGV